MTKVVDAGQGDHVICGSLAMSKADVARYIALADTADANEFHDQAIILPCKYEGSIRMAGSCICEKSTRAAPAIFTTARC